MRGRKPKPTAEKRLNGNPGKRGLNKREPDIPLTVDLFADVPEPLRGNDVAANEWRRLVPILTTARVLTDGDHAALVALCLQWAVFLDASSKVTSLVVTTRSGYPMPNPYQTVANKALGLCAKLWAELGLTPSARSRVERHDGDGKGDPFAEFDQPMPPPSDVNTATH